MSKHPSLSQVSGQVQFGKDGPQLKVVNDKIVARNAADSADIQLGGQPVVLAESADYTQFTINGGTHDGAVLIKNGTGSINDASPSGSSTLTSGTYALFYEQGSVGNVFIYNQNDSKYYMVVTIGDFSGALPSDLTGYIASFVQSSLTTTTYLTHTAPVDGGVTSGTGSLAYTVSDGSYLEYVSDELAVKVSTDTDFTNDTTKLTDRATIKTALDLKTNVADLAAVTNGNGASLIGLEDSNSRFTATDVEGALDEVKQLADNNSAGLGAQWNSVELHTMMGDGNITLSGEQTIDGTLSSTSRILLTDQTDASENGIYVTAAGAWSRATDADASSEFTQNKTVFVTGGDDAGHTMKYTGASSPTLGTDNLTFIMASKTLIPDESITTAKLDTDAVTTAKVVDGAITEAKLGSDVDAESVDLSSNYAIATDDTLPAIGDSVEVAIEKLAKIVDVSNATLSNFTPADNLLETVIEAIDAEITGSNKVHEVTLDDTDDGTNLIYTASTNSVIRNCFIAVDTVFNTAATLTVGHVGDNDEFVILADVDLEVATTARDGITVPLNYKFSGSTAINAYLTTNSATAGSVRVAVQITK